MEASGFNNSSSSSSSSSGRPLPLWDMPDWEETGKCPMSLLGTTVLIVAYSVVLAVGLVGNTCLVLVIVRQKEMRNVTNVFIANLSCSDILVCVLCGPVTAIYALMDRWILGEALCKVTNFVQCMSVTVSVLSLVLIALERHQLIIHPTGWKPTVGHSYLAVGLTWLVAFTISLPFFFYHVLVNMADLADIHHLPTLADLGLSLPSAASPLKSATNQPPLQASNSHLASPDAQQRATYDNGSLSTDTSGYRQQVLPDTSALHKLSPVPFEAFSDHWVCMERWPSVQQRRAYTTSLLVFQYVLPLVLILLCYLRIFLRLHRRREVVERTGGRDARRNAAKGSKRVSVMLAAIVVAFAVCWLPLNVFNTVFDWHHDLLATCQGDTIFSACHLVAMASTCVNPVIYGFLNSNFQKELKALLQRCHCCHWGAPEDYESFPLSIVSTGTTKGSVLSNGSVTINA